MPKIAIPVYIPVDETAQADGASSTITPILELPTVNTPVVSPYDIHLGVAPFIDLPTAPLLSFIRNRHRLSAGAYRILISPS